MKRVSCVISVAEHTGWAYVVCVAATDGVPAVITRRRVTLIEAGLPSQPYEHESSAMRADQAQALVERVRRSIASCTTLALDRLVSDLSPTHTPVALAIRKPPFARIPASVAAVRASYRLLCAADGMLYQLAICRAARRLGLDVEAFTRGGETAWATRVLGVGPAEVDAFITRTGRPAGPPWTQDHRRAYAAGIAALALHDRRRLRLSAAIGRRSATRGAARGTAPSRGWELGAGGGLPRS
jgi:hypothetical protein